VKGGEGSEQCLKRISGIRPLLWAVGKTAASIAQSLGMAAAYGVEKQEQTAVVQHRDTRRRSSRNKR
jgi:hypothetical protein